MAMMTDSELKSVLAAEIADSIAHLGGELSEQRRKALRYYLGEPFGNEQEGRSKVMSTDVADVIEWFNREGTMDPVLKAAIAHLWFVTIHPLDDGNGRIARAVADMALARSERSNQRFYSMSAQIRQQRNAYYDVLEQVQKGTLDITVWMEWFLGCLYRAIDQAADMLTTVTHKARFWEKHLGESFNARQTKVLNRMLDGFEGKLTSSKWAKLATCSQDTAYRDITDLVTRGVLRKDLGGGRSTSYSLTEP
jgi:Fic family protein